MSKFIEFNNKLINKDAIGALYMIDELFCMIGKITSWHVVLYGKQISEEYRNKEEAVKAYKKIKDQLLSLE